MKKLFLCVLFAVLVIGVSSPSYAFRNNCDAIMSDIMSENRKEKDLRMFLSEVRQGTSEHNRIFRELRATSGRKAELTREFQQCLEWRKKQQ